MNIKLGYDFFPINSKLVKYYIKCWWLPVFESFTGLHERTINK